MYRRQSGGDSVGGRPRGLEEIETDLAGTEVDVGVADWGREFYGGGREGVGGRNGDEEEPAPACVVVNRVFTWIFERRLGAGEDATL